jgi:hypothetical protein
MVKAVAIFRWFIIALTLVILVRPSFALAVGKAWLKPSRLYVAVVIRIALGVFLLLAAPSCHVPTVVQVMGVVTFLAGLSILLVGVRRVCVCSSGGCGYAAAGSACGG